MTASRQIGRLGRTLGASVFAFRTAARLTRPRIYSACSSQCTTLRWTSSATDTTGARPFVRLPELFPTHESFVNRHIGPDKESTQQMLKALSPPAESLDQFIQQVIPADILSSRELFPRPRDAFDSAATRATKQGHQEWEVQAIGRAAAESNESSRKNFIGAGYYGTITPEVIKRNVLESPAWYTSYTPYQPEISQGRLESLLNFQTLVSDLTALPISNASLLDEGTAAAEAMTVSMNALPTSRAKRPGRTYVVDKNVHPQTLNVLRSRAEGFGINVKVMDLSGSDLSELEHVGDDLIGALVQYPNTYGQVRDFNGLADAVHKQGALLSAATDLLALTVLTPPGEWGADIAFGNAQRFGVPLGFGGPHAAFFAIAEKHKRKMPGRLIGVSKDRLGDRALRLSLQTREQHIRREKATSNVCTAQALLANISAFYAVYHGPAGLKKIAERCNLGAKVVQSAARHFGLDSGSEAVAFDTVAISCPGKARAIRDLARDEGINIRVDGHDKVVISIDETVEERDLLALIKVFSEVGSSSSPEALTEYAPLLKQFLEDAQSHSTLDHVPESLRRQSAYLTHPVFNTHHSETELLRYIHHLQSKDLSLVHSMIPLGSCTMKLNASTEMALITLPGFSNIHPAAPAEDTKGYHNIINALEDQLKEITAMDGVSLQPNSGAQGEFAGLRAIRKYHESKGDFKRDICLIPVSAHGTNPASAAMAGMRVVTVKCDSKTGNLDLADLEAKCAQHSSQIGAMMITYPSTFGVFEPHIKKVCEIVHAHGGQVYMDGANMNAQIGLCSPGEIGADVCHLNLHKTFCIPHGGGGPGVGPICVKQHLVEHLPTKAVVNVEDSNHPVSSAPYGSASILPISWAYNAMMGGEGLRKATVITLLNANYLLSKLKPHYPILYTNEHGRCAHEFILDVRAFHDTAGIEAIDIAKRLQDYGFHAPTMSWPVANTLMIEPTESESQEELDRFVEALVSIRQEIREVEEGRAPREGNVLKMAPHPMADIIAGDGDAGAKWERPYTREKAAYPLPWLREKKFWPSVARVDDTYGDLNLFCTCPPVSDSNDISSVRDA
ncbi:glycine dehydrogenase [Parathielavia appendiculata]|uniref:Glycine cleavage system P protein n=1 Tax=Parathielavia appendiculata TaxID=2587402 RepID=A0AAN6U481_9PEZI|nr:glycine dehydrogenase [Parathielavia appendiculata]